MQEERYTPGRNGRGGFYLISFMGGGVMNKLVSMSVIIMLVLIGSGCSVFMAGKQPDLKNEDLFKVGTHRSALLAEFGNPISSETKNGDKCEVYKFVQGYSTGAKVGRAVGHGVADVLTLGLWEIVGTPTEATFNGDEKCYEVTFDENDRIKQVTALKK